MQTNAEICAFLHEIHIIIVIQMYLEKQGSIYMFLGSAKIEGT